MSATTNVRNESVQEGSVCSCGATEEELKSYYVWLSPANEKLKIEDVLEVAVSQEVVLFARVNEIVSIPRDRIVMVTCEICSAPPFS